MMIYSAIAHMREGKIARHKKSYYCIHNMCLCRVTSKDYYIKGIATLSGEMFASDDWEKIDEYPHIKERDYGFIVTRFGNTYGYISTGKDKEHGFAPSYQEIIDSLSKKDKGFTYATPEELAVHDHQREWTQKDRVYYNKLKFLKNIDDRQYINFLMRGLGR